LCQVVLEAGAVDEQVHARRRLTARGNRPELPVRAVFRDGDAGSKLREIQEIATWSRKFGDLCLRDVGSAFRGSRLDSGSSGDDLRRELRSLRRESKVLLLRRSDLDDDSTSLRRVADPADRNEISTRNDSD
jgi:hypothetical protein